MSDIRFHTGTPTKVGEYLIIIFDEYQFARWDSGISGTETWIGDDIDGRFVDKWMPYEDFLKVMNTIKEIK